MQVGIDVTCILNNFGGHGLLFQRYCYLQKRPKFPFRPWTIVHGGQKLESAQIIHARRGRCEMHAHHFWWAWPLWFWRFCPFLSAIKNSQNFPLDHGLYSPWLSKNLIDWNWLRKFMQVGMNVSCMHTNFDGRGFSGFRDIATFKNGQVSLSDHGLTVHCCQKN